MPITVMLHLSGEDPILGEMDELPAAADTMVKLVGPRRRDGKDLPYLQGDVVTVIWPMTRVNFIEVMPSREEEEIIGFVRE
jgi:hypothetical protein